MINKDLTFSQQANELDKTRNKISVSVNNNIKGNYSEEKEILKKSKYIICPECKENTQISIDNYKITLYNCKNNR